MAFDAGAAKGRVLLDDSNYQDGVKRVGVGSKNLTSSMLKAQLGAQALSKAFSLITRNLSDTVKMYSVQEKSEKMLAQAMKNSGKFTERAYKHNLEYASSLQKMSVFGDETILTVQTMLSAFKVEGEMLDELTKATLDLASAKGMDLKSAGDLVAKSVGSSTNALSRYGIEVDGAAGSTQRMESAVKNISSLFGGAAKAEAETFSGKVAQLNNRLGDIKESIGKEIIPLLEKAINWFQKLTGETQTLVIAIGALTPVIAGLWVALGPLGVAFLALGAATIAVATNMGKVNKEAAISIEMQKGLTNAVDEILIKYGDQETIQKKQIETNNELIKQKKEEIDQARQMIGMQKPFNQGIFTEAEFKRGVADIQKEINELEEKNRKLKEGTVEVKKRDNKLTEDQINLIKQLEEADKNTAKNRIARIKDVLNTNLISVEQRKLAEVELAKLIEESQENAGDEILSNWEKVTNGLKDKFGSMGNAVVEIGMQIASAAKQAFSSIFDSVISVMTNQLEVMKDTHEKELEAIEERLDAETELKVTKEEERAEVLLENLEAQREAELISDEEYKERKKEIEMQKANNVTAIEKQKNDKLEQEKQKRRDKENAKKKEIFEAQKKNQIAEAWIEFAIGTVSAWAGAIQAFASIPVVGPALAIAMGAVLTGLLLGTTIAQTVAISSQQFIPEKAQGGLAEGLTRVNESGRGEILNLPGGTTVIPADVSRMIGATAGKMNSININVSFAGANINNDMSLRRISDYVSKDIAKKLRLAL